MDDFSLNNRKTSAYLIQNELHFANNRKTPAYLLPYQGGYPISQHFRSVALILSE